MRFIGRPDVLTGLSLTSVCSWTQSDLKHGLCGLKIKRLKFLRSSSLPSPRASVAISLQSKKYKKKHPIGLGYDKKRDAMLANGSLQAVYCSCSVASAVATDATGGGVGCLALEFRFHSDGMAQAATWSVGYCQVKEQKQQLVCTERWRLLAGSTGLADEVHRSMDWKRKTRRASARFKEGWRALLNYL